MSNIAKELKFAVKFFLILNVIFLIFYYAIYKQFLLKIYLNQRF